MPRSFRSLRPPYCTIKWVRAVRAESARNEREEIAGRRSVQTGECTQKFTLLPLLLRSFRRQIYFISTGGPAPSHQHQQYATSMQFPFAHRGACELWPPFMQQVHIHLTFSFYGFSLHTLTFFRFSLCANRFCLSEHDTIPLPYYRRCRALSPIVTLVSGTTCNVRHTAHTEPIFTRRTWEMQ